MPGVGPEHRFLCAPAPFPAPKGRGPRGADVRVAQRGRVARQASAVLGWMHPSVRQDAAQVCTPRRRCGGVAGKCIGRGRAARDVFLAPVQLDGRPHGVFAVLQPWYGHRGGPMPGVGPQHCFLCGPAPFPAPKGRGPRGADVRVAPRGRAARQSSAVLGWLHRSVRQGAAQVFTPRRRRGGVARKGVGRGRAAREVFLEPLQLDGRPHGVFAVPVSYTHLTLPTILLV